MIETWTFVIGPFGELYKCWVDVGRKEKIIGSIYDGGCILRRYNQTHHGIPYEPCPVKEEDYVELLELLYETKNGKI